MVINLNKLNQLISTIRSTIKDYELSAYDVLSNIKNTFYYWHDGYTESFFQNIDKERLNVDDIISCLYKLLDLLSNLKVFYIPLNNLIKEIINYNSMVIDLDYFLIKSSDDDLTKEKKQKITRKIKNIENDMEHMISRLSIPFVSRIAFDNLDLSNVKYSDFVGMTNEMNKKIQDIQLKYRNYQILNDKIMAVFKNIANVYNSKNTRKIIAKVDELNHSIHILNTNLNSSIDYMTKRHYEISKILINNLLDMTKKIDFN